MNMEKLQMCRLCLVEDVRMFNITNKDLQTVYEKLTDIPFVTEDSRPMLACVFCFTKLKQCCQLQRKCLEAEKLLSQMLNEDFETKPQLYKDLLEYFSGFVITPMVHVSCVPDDCLSESDDIKEELPDDCEEHNDSFIKEEHEIEFENQDLRVMPTNHSESNSEDDTPLIEYKTKEETDVFQKKQTSEETKKLTESVPEDTSNPENQEQRIEQIKCSVKTAKETHCCPQCDKKFQWRGNLLRHLKSHVARATGELVCKPCNRTFSSIATYQQHMKISKKHVSENDFKHMCSDCGKRFSDKTRLRDHVNWDHLKKYEHICSVCQKAFKSYSTLYLHKQVVHNKDNKEHLCDHCGKSFGNQAKLRCHMLALHSSQTYSCVTCGARFSWLSCLKRHNNKLHPKTCRLPQDAK